MTIGGAAAGTAAASGVINPATGRPRAAAPECSREQPDAAFAAAVARANATHFGLSGSVF
ncbi:MAG: hypothetical protein JWR24_4385 [Actinoallomurus sp.]|nr:hypothetical protein [Actinoallomurus sp.]